MAGYLIVDVEVKDPEAYERYKGMVPATLEEYGGKFLVRGGETAIMEGTWQPKRFVVVEFPSVEQARAWWSSEGYREPKALRQSASVTNMIVVDGGPPPQ